MKAQLKELSPKTFVSYKGKRWMILRRQDGFVVLMDRERKSVKVKADTRVNL